MISPPQPLAEGAPRESFSFTNAKGLKICLYNETPKPDSSKAEKIVLLCHGLQSHYELEFCASLVEDENRKKLVKLNTDAAWARQINEIPGVAVYGIDHQGHGASEGWKGDRTNVETFDDYGHDIIQALTEIAKRHSAATPILLVGISLGGQIVTRSLQLMGMKEETLPFHLVSVVLLAPALSIELLKKKPFNRIALPFAPIASKLVPTLQVGAVENHPFYPMIDEYKLQDPKAGKGKIPARLSHETVVACDTIMKDSNFIGKKQLDLKIQFIHSEADGFVDPQGSQKMHEKLTHLKNRKLTLLKEETGMWHYLTMEIGTVKHVLSEVITACREMPTH